jgi:hypothetical protein
MLEQDCVPYAPALIESMRSIGYTFPAAVADLIDNSISSHSTRIEIFENATSTEL